jgi:hypothetical protein
VAASAAIIARDLGVGLARQILIYPMLDDRTVSAGAVAPFLTWTSDMNLDRVRCARASKPGSRQGAEVAGINQTLAASVLDLYAQTDHW